MSDVIEMIDDEVAEATVDWAALYKTVNECLAEVMRARDAVENDTDTAGYLDEAAFAADDLLAHIWIERGLRT
jgi:hypothetical protein